MSVPVALGTGDLEPCTLPTLLQIRAVCTASIHVTVSFPTSQAGSEISCEMCDSGTPVPFSGLNTANFAFGEKQRNLWAPPGGRPSLAPPGAHGGLGARGDFHRSWHVGPTSCQSLFFPLRLSSATPRVSSLKPRQEGEPGPCAGSRLGGLKIHPHKQAASEPATRWAHRSLWRRPRPRDQLRFPPAPRGTAESRLWPGPSP